MIVKKKNWNDIKYCWENPRDFLHIQNGFMVHFCTWDFHLIQKKGDEILVIRS